MGSVIFTAVVNVLNECFASETTANTFATTLAYLAINPEAQDEAVQQIIDVVGWDRDPVSSTSVDKNAP